MSVETGGRQWSLYWTSRGRPVPGNLVPVLAGWSDLDQREDAADIGPGHPILIDPEYRLDPLLARFLSRSRFTWLADGTKQAYAKDYRLFFSFLWQRGKYWHEADPDDLLDWEAWRRRGQQTGRRISGSKWQRELAAFRLLYEWAEKKDHIARSPVLVHEVRLRDGGGTVMVADQAPRDVRSSDVKWVTPRTYRLWRDTGLLGYDVGGQPDLSWRGRNDGRNAAFTDLLFSSGLRLREGGCLLTLKVPDATAGHRYYEGSVAGAVAKRRERMFYASAASLRRVAGYIATTRAEAVRRARRHRRYDRVPGKLIVTGVSHGPRPKLYWLDDLGRAGEARIGALTPPIHPAVMSPLLVWSLRFTEDLAPDILAALAEQQRLRSRIAASHNPDAARPLAALLDEHARSGTPLPGEHVKGRRSAACSYLAGLTGASIVQANNAVRRSGLPVGDIAPLDIAITGTVHGRPWTSHVSYHQAQALALRLAAACLVVVAYLSGLRPAEVLHLGTGCCPFKGVRSADGTPAPEGKARQWTVIAPVATAIGILEQLTTTCHLFPLRPAWMDGARPQPRRHPLATPGTRGSRQRTGQVITAKAANARITEFITWVNDYARERGLDSEVIPADPDGTVTLRRFSRTVAWHIARLPGGRIALAIQYGHLRTVTSEGYSGRARHGLARVLDIETAAVMASYLSHASERLDAGDAAPRRR